MFEKCKQTKSLNKMNRRKENSTRFLILWCDGVHIQDMILRIPSDVTLSFYASILVSFILLKISVSQANIAVGYGVDIFRYWGDLGYFLKNDVSNVMLPVFQNPVAISRQLEGEGRSLLKGGLQIELCRDVSQLLEAFFRHYYVERSKRPWRIFSAGWSKSKIGKKLGLNSTYLSGQHGYAFIRMSRYRQSVSLDPILQNEEFIYSHINNNLQSIVPGDAQSVLEFFSTSGSHYISSFITGDALYQVFVYSIPTFLSLQQQIKEHGTNNLSSEDFIKFFSPWYSEHVGNIMVMSENPLLESWANNNFLLRMSIFSYPSLIKLHISPEMSLQMDQYMGNNALLHVDMRTLESVFKDFNKRFWFQQVLDNYMKLWEENG